MDPGLLRAGLFALAALSVFALAAVEGCLRVAEALRWRTTPPGPLRRRFRLALFSLAGIGLACVLYGRFVEPFWPEVTHHRVPHDAVPRGAQPLRIAHLTDLHCDPVKRLEDRIPAMVAAESPDLIVFTGDCLNHRDGLPHFREVMTALSRIAPTCAVRGNWDVWYWKDLDLFAGTGVRELNGDSHLVEVRGVPVRIGGVAYNGESLVGSTLLPHAPGEISVFLFHTPDLVFELADRGVDLAFAGHTHGGQVALPFYGALITLSAFDKQFERGMHRVRSTWQYTGRGIGMEGGRAPRVRFCARPEIAVVDVVHSDDLDPAEGDSR